MATQNIPLTPQYRGPHVSQVPGVRRNGRSLTHNDFVLIRIDFSSLQIFSVGPESTYPVYLLLRILSRQSAAAGHRGAREPRAAQWPGWLQGGLAQRNPVERGS